MVIRGISCLIPGIEGFTENISIRSIVGRYLEHSRIYIFGTGDRQKIFISSADFMTRNTVKRVEVAAPVYSEEIKKRIIGMFNILMKDLIKLMQPKYIEVWGKFTPRGGISIDPYCNYGKPGTKWEEIAFNRMANHDMYPEKVDNR